MIFTITSAAGKTQRSQKKPNTSLDKTHDMCHAFHPTKCQKTANIASRPPVNATMKTTHTDK